MQKVNVPHHQLWGLLVIMIVLSVSLRSVRQLLILRIRFILQKDLWVFRSRTLRMRQGEFHTMLLKERVECALFTSMEKSTHPRKLVHRF